MKTLLQRCGFHKRSGVEVNPIMYCLTMSVWLKSNSVSLFAKDSLRTFCAAGKDVLYEAMNREDWNWRALHLRVACKALQQRWWSPQTQTPRFNPNAGRRSNAQRQADYRARHLKNENAPLERLSLLVDLHAKRALERLASCYGVTQRAMLERLLRWADLVTQKQADEHSPNGQSDYFDKCITLQWSVVTR